MGPFIRGGYALARGLDLPADLDPWSRSGMGGGRGTHSPSSHRITRARIAVTRRQIKVCEVDTIVEGAFALLPAFLPSIDTIF